jgi:hypothetical protein
LIESVNHLFLERDFARACWGLLGLTVTSSPCPFQRFRSFKEQINKKFFMEIIIIMCWCIWSARNDMIIRGIRPSCLRSLELFKGVFKLLLWRVKRKYFPSIKLWIEAGTKPEKIIGGAEQNCYIDLTLL